MRYNSKKYFNFLKSLICIIDRPFLNFLFHQRRSVLALYTSKETKEHVDYCYRQVWVFLHNNFSKPVDEIDFTFYHRVYFKGLVTVQQQLWFCCYLLS
jgi:hypothetical protein